MQKIDVFPHIFPRGYFNKVCETVPGFERQPNHAARPAIHDLDTRFRMMDRFADYVQVLTLASPPIEAVAVGWQGLDLARLANDGLAELVQRYPERFLGFAASVMLENIDGSIREAERAITDLGALGVQIATNVNGHPLDETRFEPLFARMAELDKVIWVHPARTPAVADYASESASKYGLWLKIGWPYETAVFMSRLIFSGLMERYPRLRILTHHAGGLVPHLAGRVVMQHDLPELRASVGADDRFDEALVLAGYRRFYGDTVFSGAHHPLRCSLEFFGHERLLFGTDMPFGADGGEMFVRETIAAIDELTVDNPALRSQLFEGNARALLRL